MNSLNLAQQKTISAAKIPRVLINYIILEQPTMSFTVHNLSHSRTSTLPSNSQTNNEYSGNNNKVTAISTAPKADILTLSQTAKSLNNNGQTLANIAEIDLEKVANIKKALANGTYLLDSEKVTAKFIEIETLLGKL